MADTNKMTVACLDFEGVLIPEIWKGLALLSGIDDLRIVDYCLRQKDQKRHAVKALKKTKFQYNFSW